jgi:hypothetical protein
MISISLVLSQDLDRKGHLKVCVNNKTTAKVMLKNPKPLMLVIPVVKNVSLLQMHILIEKGYEKKWVKDENNSKGHMKNKSRQ